jgi:hypothetical protein
MFFPFKPHRARERAGQRLAPSEFRSEERPPLVNAAPDFPAAAPPRR